jgi:hypothetical protein
MSVPHVAPPGKTRRTRPPTLRLDRVRGCDLFAYQLPTEPFRPHPEVGGYWVADEAVEAVEAVELVAVGNLLARHAAAGIELRITRRSGRSGGESRAPRWSSVAPGSATLRPIPTSSRDERVGLGCGHDDLTFASTTVRHYGATAGRTRVASGPSRIWFG